MSYSDIPGCHDSIALSGDDPAPGIRAAGRTNLISRRARLTWDSPAAEPALLVPQPRVQPDPIGTCARGADMADPSTHE